ncbi:MAG: class I SAM-dependent methyltransferase [Ilumatobacteraceae bacterium]
MNLIPHSTGSYVHGDDPGEPTTGEPRLSITEVEGEMLAVLAAGRSVLEFGTGLGVSTRALARTARKVYTVDIDEWVQETIWPTLPDNVSTCDDRDRLPIVDMVFIDGDHTEEGTAADVAAAMRLASEVIVMHDTSAPTVRSACDDEWLFIGTTHGLGVRWL